MTQSRLRPVTGNDDMSLTVNLLQRNETIVHDLQKLSRHSGAVALAKTTFLAEEHSRSQKELDLLCHDRAMAVLWLCAQHIQAHSTMAHPPHSTAPPIAQPRLPPFEGFTSSHRSLPACLPSPQTCHDTTLFKPSHGTIQPQS